MARPGRPGIAAEAGHQRLGPGGHRGLRGGVAFTEGLGLDPALLIEAITGGPLDSPYFQLKTKAITERRFDPQFKLALAAKDGSLMEEAMRRHHLELPLVTAVAQQMARGAEQNPDKDMSASYLTMR